MSGLIADSALIVALMGISIVVAQVPGWIYDLDGQKPEAFTHLIAAAMAVFAGVLVVSAAYAALAGHDLQDWDGSSIGKILFILMAIVGLVVVLRARKRQPAWPTWIMGGMYVAAGLVVLLSAVAWPIESLFPPQ